MININAFLPFIIGIPKIIVWIVGIILSIGLLKKQKKKAWLIISAMGIAIIEMVANFIIHTQAISRVLTDSISAEELAATNAALLIASSVTTTTVFILILIALFTKEKTKKNEQQ